jgi:broad specificity phosphatase PhoE
MRLLLIRHGQTPSNVLGQLDTAPPGARLTPLGESQARAVPGALELEPIERIYASTLVRTQLTAHPLSEVRALEVDVLAGLREVEAGELEMRNDKHSQAVYVSTALSWAEGKLDNRMPGGPNGHEFFARYNAAISEIVESGVRTAVAFSHGASIRTWVAGTCTNIEGSYAATHQLDNTGAVILEGSVREGWTMVDWRAAPIGGSVLVDLTAEDPTGETLADAERLDESAHDVAGETLADAEGLDTGA